MSSQKPLRIDFSIKNAVLQAVPREPLLTSDGLNWSGCRLEYQHQPAHETPDLIPKQHIISISTGQPFLREWKDNS
jgi:AraC family transcriptional regulator